MLTFVLLSKLNVKDLLKFAIAANCTTEMITTLKNYTVGIIYSMSDQLLE